MTKTLTLLAAALAFASVAAPAQAKVCHNARGHVAPCQVCRSGHCPRAEVTSMQWGHGGARKSISWSGSDGDEARVQQGTRVVDTPSERNTAH